MGFGGQKMKITITNYNKTYSVESDEDLDAEDLADMFKGLMVNMGFHPKNVDELFNTEFKWFPEDELRTEIDSEVLKRGLEDFSNSLVNKWHKDCQEGK